MAYKLKRIGKKAYKFEYLLVLHSLAIEVSNHKWSPNQVSIAFSRRGKRLYSKLLKWEPSINKPCHGYVVWPEPERLSTVVTLYKGQRDKEYESKEWEVSVVEVTREGRKKCLGRIPLNMSNYAGDLIGSNQDLRLKLKPSGRKMKLLDLDCSLGSRFLRAGKSTDSDMHSQTSMMSMSQLSSISDMEDVDLIDLKDLDTETDGDVFSEAVPEVVTPSIYYPPKYIQQEDLLAWSQKCVEGYHGASVHNFTTSWRNGLAFSAIIHRFRPDLLDFDSLQPHEVIPNNKIAFEAAASLGVPRIIQPEQMESWLVPDRLSVTAFIYQLYIRLAPGPLSALSRSDPIPSEERQGESSAMPKSTTQDSIQGHTHVRSSISAPYQEIHSVENRESVQSTSPSSSKHRRTLPPIPKHPPSNSPHSKMRVRDFLSSLDHPPNKARSVSPHRLEKNRRSPIPPPSSSDNPFFGRKATRKQTAASRPIEEPPSDQIIHRPLAVTASMEREFKQIDSEFDTHDLFDNSLFQAVAQELSPGPMSPAEPGLKPLRLESDPLEKSKLLGRQQNQDSLLDIISDPSVIQTAKQQLKKKSLRMNKNPLLNNPLYSSQDSDDISSSETCVVDSGAALVPSSLTLAATPRLSPRASQSATDSVAHKAVGQHRRELSDSGPAADNSCGNGRSEDCPLKKKEKSTKVEAKDNYQVETDGRISVKKSLLLTPEYRESEIQSDEKETSVNISDNMQVSMVNEEIEILTERKLSKKQSPVNISVEKKEVNEIGEVHLKSRVRRKKASLKNSEARDLSESRAGNGKERGGCRLDEVKARIKSRRKQNRKRPEVKQCVGEPTLVIKRYASISHMDRMSDDDTFQQESSDTCLSEQELGGGTSQPDRGCSDEPVGRTIGAKEQVPSSSHSSYQYVLEQEREESTPRLLELYHSRIAPGVEIQKQASIEPDSGNTNEGGYVSKDITGDLPINQKTGSHDEQLSDKRLGALSLSEVCQDSSSSNSSSSILYNEETDYVAHMQKKLCSMQISLDSRQAELRDRIREAENNNNNELHNSLLENWFQLIQQKAHLDNRYDDLILITETHDLAVKERLLRRELEHKMQIDRSIKSREQLWEEDVLCGEIAQIERERRQVETRPLTTMPVVNVNSAATTRSNLEPPKKVQQLTWRDKLLNILA